MDKTTNYNLNKPAKDELYSVEVWNKNMDSIDSQMKTNATDINNIKTSINSQDQKFDNIENEINEVNKNLQLQSEDIYKYQEDVENLKNSYSSLSENVDKHDDDILNHEERILYLEENGSGSGNGSNTTTITGTISANNIYSLEERVVGTWTDGKPLYQKTLQFNNITLEQGTEIEHGIENMDYFMLEDYIIYDKSGSVIYSLTGGSDGTADSSNRLIGFRLTPTIILETGTSSWVANELTDVYFVIRYTKTTDEPGTIVENKEGTLKPWLYDTENEVVIGIYDGKPLYRKTVSCGSLPNNTNIFINIGVENIENIIKMYGITYGDENTNNSLPLPFSYGSVNTEDIEISYHQIKNAIRITTFKNKSNYIKTYVTIEYTKTTDAEGSGNGLMPYGNYTISGSNSDIDSNTQTNYSTDEQIIGTWIDGKTLYRKVVSLGAFPDSNKFYISSTLTDVDNVVDLRGFAKAPDNYMIPLNYPSIDGDSSVALSYKFADNMIEVVQGVIRTVCTESYAIVEYTKTDVVTLTCADKL